MKCQACVSVLFERPSVLQSGLRVVFPRGSIYTTIMELGTERPSLLWLWGPNSMMVVYMDPLGFSCGRCYLFDLRTGDYGMESVYN